MKDWAKPLKNFFGSFSSKENKKAQPSKPKSNENGVKVTVQINPLVGTMTPNDPSVKILEEINRRNGYKKVDKQPEE